MLIGLLGAGPKKPGLNSDLDAAIMAAISQKAGIQRHTPAVNVAPRQAPSPAVVVAIDPRADERAAEMARRPQNWEAMKAASTFVGDRPYAMAEPDWDKKMNAEMIDAAKRQVWAISETLRNYDETGEVVSFGLYGERFVDTENWKVYGGPEKFIEMMRKGLEISKAGLRDLEGGTNHSA
jgi:hypothetical protein